IGMADSSPSNRRTTSPRLAHGHALLTTSRYRPASTGQPSRPSAVIRASKAFGARTNSPVSGSVGILMSDATPRTLVLIPDAVRRLGRAALAWQRVPIARGGRRGRHAGDRFDVPARRDTRTSH